MIVSEKTMKSEKIYEGRILNLRIDTVELPDKKYSKREIIEHASAVAIIPITADGKLIMVKQFRKAIEQVMMELPAGLIEPNEEPPETAMRELREETGFAAAKMEYLFDGYSSPGFTDEKCSFFLATDLYEDSLKLDEDEFVDKVIISIEEAFQMVQRNELTDLKTIVGVLVAKEKLEKTR